MPEYREYAGEFGKVLVRRDKIAGLWQMKSGWHPLKTGIRVDGQSLHVVEEYEAVRDWVLGDDR